jgi:hypothetical protein
MKHIAGYKDKMTYEPFAGHDAIVDILTEFGFKYTISHDLYTRSGGDCVNYFTNYVTEYDLLVSNPPWLEKHAVVDKAVASHKPFALLLPLSILGTHESYLNLKRSNFSMIVLNPNPKFMRCGVPVDVGTCAWFLGNFPADEMEGGRFVYVNIDA